jgi:bleomycin hydrolase
MGSNQSRPSDAAVNEKLMERLQALHVKDERPMNEKDGFVVVGGEARMCIASMILYKSNW